LFAILKPQLLMSTGKHQAVVRHGANGRLLFFLAIVGRLTLLGHFSREIHTAFTGS
jgi:hypothetical protein